MFEDPNVYDVEAFIQGQGWEYKTTSGGQFVVRVCPMCGKDKWHFYIKQEQGLWDCKVCGATGNLWHLRKQFGGNILSHIQKATTTTKAKPVVYPKPEHMVAYHENLAKNKKAMDYLLERGFTPETIEKFYLGVTGDGKIALPIIKDEKLVNIKYRTMPPADKFYMREKDCPSYLFNGDAVTAGKPIMLVEGEFDAIAATQMGFVAVSGVTGAQGLVKTEMEQLDAADRVVVVYDSDEAGQKGAKKIIERLGFERCVNVVLPVKDMNEFMTSGHTREELAELIGSADKVKPEMVYSFSELMGQIDHDDNGKGLALGYPKLDEQFSGMGPGQVLVVGAETRVGKSTFANNIASDMAKRNIPVLVFSLENQPRETVKRMSSIIEGKPFGSFTRQDVADMTELYEQLPLYFYFAGDKETTMSVVREVSIAAKKYYGIQAIFLDHIHFFARSAQNQTSEISILIMQIKQLAVKLGVPIMVISHTARKDKENRIPTINDLKNSSSLGQDADQVLMLWRNLTPIDEADKIDEMDRMDYARKQSEMVVRIHKDRNGPGYGDFDLKYDLPSGKITERII